MNTAVSSAQDARMRETQFTGDISKHRVHTQETAQRLSVVAMRQWEKAMTGIVALPAAAALTTAATVLFTASFIERGFEIIEGTLVDVGQRIGSELDLRGNGGSSGWEHERGDIGTKSAHS